MTDFDAELCGFRAEDSSFAGSILALMTPFWVNIVITVSPLFEGLIKIAESGEAVGIQDGDENLLCADYLTPVAITTSGGDF